MSMYNYLRNVFCNFAPIYCCLLKIVTVSVCLNSKISYDEFFFLQIFMMYSPTVLNLKIEFYLLVVLLCRQIEIDSKFLEVQHIMDYSLLLGVHYRAPQQLRPSVSFNQSIGADGLAMLAEEGGYQIQSNKLMICD